jgi:3-oxoacyl-[acyl-carrier-protein] synthase III
MCWVPVRWRNGVMNDAYITGTGAYLPGDPVDNEELKARLGALAPSDARLRDRTLAANGIRTRHYAVDGGGQTLMLNEELAAHAISRALADRGLETEAVRMLATGTTQGDCLVPGFSSMVHGRLGGGPMELLSASGVCASGMAAMRAAVSAVRLGEHPVAVAAGSELVSRSLLTRPAATPDTGFLRWTLSDGAGAVVVEPEPRPDGLSLRVDWMHLVSHAHDHPVCMSAGLGDGRAGSTWLDNEAAGIPVLRQDMTVLPALLELGVAEFDALVKAGRIDPETEHILCHFSAEHFRGTLFGLLRAAGYAPDEERWFTNLHTAGNTGAASIYVMLDAVRPRLRDGDRVLLVVPESGRFTLAFAHLTCVGPSGKPAGKAAAAGLAASPLGAPSPDDDPVITAALAGLAGVWAELERALSRVPVIRRIEDGTATLGDYRRLLLNLRQQVVDGGRWISLAAANFSTDLFWLRSAAIKHAADEHRDYQMLERDYAAVGGDPDVMASTPANVGSCALSAFVFHRAGLPDPVDLLGTMFVIEGLGLRKAGLWADQLQAGLGLTGDQVSFLRYHATGDDEHFGILRGALRSGVFDDAAMARIVKTARVTARLYALQLEELDNV